jgi:hypothetical protein
MSTGAASSSLQKEPKASATRGGHFTHVLGKRSLQLGQLSRVGRDDLKAHAAHLVGRLLSP